MGREVEVVERGRNPIRLGNNSTKNSLTEKSRSSQGKLRAQRVRKDSKTKSESHNLAEEKPSTGDLCL